MRPILRRKLLPLFLFSGIVGPVSLDAATIVVGTADQKIDGIGPCSLQEAIYASDLRASLTIVQTDPDVFAASNCTAGTGNDTIVLPSGALFPMTTFLDGDAYNPYGPTATPIVFSTITIEGNGSTIEWTGTGNTRLFAVGPASIQTPSGTVSGTGDLTLRNLYVKGFHVKGGDGRDGGGGGLGAGGGVYLQDGTLTIENCTFDGNGANGGKGALPGNVDAGGGGGLAGNGGHGAVGGGGGGGARDGGDGYTGGGGGGGTIFAGAKASGDSAGSGGYLCGGNGGDGALTGNDGHPGSCPGGGGGGAGGAVLSSPRRDGGRGNYGGGGGGGSSSGPAGGQGNGGDGGFGGGGGAGFFESTSGSPGNGGFGGGGGAPEGNAGPFGGRADLGTGGGGGALGGAIFNDSGKLTVRNSTFTNNYTSLGTGAHNGGDAGAAIFSHNGSTTIVDCTIAANEGTVSGAGIGIWEDGATTSLTLNDTIVANNGDAECFVHGAVTSAGIGNLILNNGSGGDLAACPGVAVTQDPNLGSLHMNGGKTPTMALFLGSPALGHADSATSLGTDQRGATRPQNAAFDIGAYELCRGKFGLVSCHFEFLIPSIAPAGLSVDDGGSATSDNNGVLEPGETVPVKPSWSNLEAGDVALSATASGLTGPTGPSYTVADGTGDYGAIAPDTVGECVDCYVMSASKPASRPATHWDLLFTEITNQGETAKLWTLHVGESFTDVPKTQPFYRKIETLLHSGITAGCTATNYCPGDDVSRAQMAIFLARAIAGGAANIPISGSVNGNPYDCVSGGTSLFTDVPPTDGACKAIHYIAAKNVTLGCAATLFCPDVLVSRAQMGIFLAKAIVAPAGGAGVPLTYGPDPVTGFSYSCDPSSQKLHFTDVSITDSFCKHVHFLWAKGIVSGCSATAYCPSVDVSRDAMAKFLVNAFQFKLYGP